MEIARLAVKRQAEMPVEPLGISLEAISGEQRRSKCC